MPIVEATLAASYSQDKLLAKLIEQAMSQAATKAIGEGITDPAEIRARMLAARKSVKQQIAPEGE